MVYNNLYPPVMDALMPAFIITQDKGGVPGDPPYQLYFSLSKYNSLEMIQHAWLSLTDSSTNKTMLTSATEVEKLEVKENTNKDGDNRFYVEIPMGKLKNGWRINKVYKAQIRFSSVGEDPANPLPEIANTMSAIVEGQNANRFSEWSTVALLQPILEPQLEIRGFSTNEVILSSLGNVVSGRINFSDGGELESYKIEIYKNNTTELLYSSGIIFSDVFSTNEIYHKLRYGFVEGERYKMKVTYTTKSAYTGSKTYSFLILSATGEPLDAKLEVIPNNSMGRMEIHVSSDTEQFLGNLTIRRASSKENFTIWEDVQHIATTQDGLLSATWYDYGVENGVWYKYCIQKRNARGDRGLAVMCKEPTMLLLDDIFISDADRCLRVKFNPQISSYTHVLTESSTQAIGAKYPFIKRNGNTHYRQFSISGLISHFMDEGDLFTNKEELFENNISLYEKYNEENRITDYNDFILEKKFREKIEDFLYDGKVKLFRSAPEGTMLIRLMNISLNPEPTLGRMLYSFTATAYEIADLNIDNLKKYNLQKIGNLEKIVIGNYEKSGQFILTDSSETRTTIDLIKKLQEEENGFKGAFNYKRTIKYLNKIKIYFTTPPKLYNITDTSSLDNIKVVRSNSSSIAEGNLFYGYAIEINGKIFLINPKITNTYFTSTSEATGQFNRTYYGYYELEGENLQITSLYIKAASALIDYNLVGQEEEDMASIPKEIYLSSQIGQITGYFNSTDELKHYFEAKHTRRKGKLYEDLYSISEMSIEAEPNTVFYLQDSRDLDYVRFVLGETGTLNISNINSSIKDICFLGKHLIEKEKNSKGTYLNRETFNNEFILNFGALYKDVSKIDKPEKNCVYRVETLEGISLPRDINKPSVENSYLIDLASWVTQIEDNQTKPYYTVIYYNEQWFLFTYKGKNDIVMPTYIQLDYRCEIEKGEYK